MKPLQLNRFFGIVFIIFIVSCAPQRVAVYEPPAPERQSVKVLIDSYSDENQLTGKNICLISADSSYSGNYLLYKRVIEVLKRDLTEKGYTLSNQSDADYIVVVQYGTSDPNRVDYEYSVPVYGSTGIISSQSKASYDYFNNYKVDTKYDQAYGIVGSRTEKYSSTYYTHYLILSAYSKSESSSNFSRNLKWKVLGRHVGSSNDFREVLPYLVCGIDPYIQKDSYYKTHSTIYLDDPKLEYITTGSYPAVKSTSATSTSPAIPKVILSEDEKRINRLKSNPASKREKCTSSSLKVGDVVCFKSPFGEEIFGIIDGNESKKVKVRIFPTPGTSSFEMVSNNEELYKILE